MGYIARTSRQMGQYIEGWGDQYPVPIVHLFLAPLVARSHRADPYTVFGSSSPVLYSPMAAMLVSSADTQWATRRRTA